MLGSDSRDKHFPVVILGIGQCGVTIAHEFFMQFQDNPSYHPTFFFTPFTNDWIPRCVLLDTEPKVVQQILHQCKKKKPWMYHPKCVLSKKTGAANNWAYGYHCHGASMYDFIRKAVRYQVRECGPQFGGFVILQSLAGGTGSGLGSYVTEQLRKDYPHATLINQIVWPFCNGEVIVQHYNMMFTLHRLIKHSSLVLLLFNDHLQTICESRLGRMPSSFTDLNQFIALILFHLLAPSMDPCTRQCTLLSSLVQLLVHASTMNLVTVYLVPQVPPHAIQYSTFTWHMLLNSLHRMVLSSTPTDETLPSCSTLATLKPRLFSLVLLLKYEKTLYSGLEVRDKEMLQKFSNPSHFVKRKVRVGLFKGKDTGVAGIPQLVMALW